MKMVFSKLKPILTAIIQQSIILFPAILVIRIFDLFLFEKEIFVGTFEIFRVFGIIVFKEFLFLILYLLTIGLILAIVKQFSKSIYWILMVLFSLITLFVYLVTSQYFHTAYLLLDYVILFFTLDELLEIAASETGRLANQYFWFYFLPTLIFILAIFFNKKLISLISSNKVIKILLASGLVLLVVNYIEKNSKLNDKRKSIVISKPQYLTNSMIQHLSEKNDFKNLNDQEFASTIIDFRDFMDWEESNFQFDYPFARKLDINESDLSKYFNDFEKAPNVVIVFCEGLSSTFSGTKAVIGDFTPNLTELYSKSLYWPHTISNTDRTHGVFANALASLPHGYVRGMLNLKTTFPQHLSIPKILVSNGYSSSFIYGGWGYFDNFEPYLKMNYVQNIRDKVMIENKNIAHLASKEGEFTWGFHDKQMVDLYFKFKDTSSFEPFLDIFITLSLHSPFNIPEKEKYLDLSKEMLKNFESGDLLYENYKEVIAAIIYQDHALGNFMKEYKERQEYENTIFVFVGDHNVNTLPLRTELDSHYVPLAIFSPKLKESKTFKDIVAHTDIPNGLLTILTPYLDGNTIPEFTNWLGDGLSTNNKVSATQPKFLGRFNGDIIGVINNDTLLINDKTYQISEKLELKEIDGGVRKAYFKSQLLNYKMLNSYTIDKLKLLLPKDVLKYPNAEAAFFYPED